MISGTNLTFVSHTQIDPSHHALILDLQAKYLAAFGKARTSQVSIPRLPIYGFIYPCKWVTKWKRDTKTAYLCGASGGKISGLYKKAIFSFAMVLLKRISFQFPLLTAFSFVTHLLPT